MAGWVGERYRTRWHARMPDPDHGYIYIIYVMLQPVHAHADAYAKQQLRASLNISTVSEPKLKRGGESPAQPLDR